MTPEQLSKSGSEHGEQRALFGWAVVAEAHGFDAAFDDMSYIKGLAHIEAVYPNRVPVPELARMFAIPNGGLRDKVTAAKLKHEGVKRGVPDVMLPLPCRRFAGLFVEMKRSEEREAGAKAGKTRIKRRAGVTSEFQDDWIGALRNVGYACSVCFDWRSAARDVQSYIEMARQNNA